MTITLYDMHDSPHARKVRLLAAELGIPLKTIARDPRKGETRSPEYLAKNPNGRVRFWRKTASSCGNRPRSSATSPPSVPNARSAGPTPKSEGLVNQWLFWWTGGPEAAINALFWERIIKPKVLNRPGNDPGILADATARLSRFLPVLDRQLEGRDYVIGPLSIADFAMAPGLERGPDLLEFDVAPYRNIAAWLARLATKPYWATA